jgi:hypothetical protein
VSSFVNAVSAAEARQRLSEYALLALALGRSIGVPAEIAAPAGLDARCCKAVGAGNELGMCLLPNSASPGSLDTLSAPLAEQGVIWED